MGDGLQNRRGTVIEAAALVGQLGFVIAIPIVLGVWAGRYVDRWVGAHGLVLMGFVVLGIVAGVFNAYRVVTKLMGGKH